jgi:hypothetical protein
VKALAQRRPGVPRSAAAAFTLPSCSARAKARSVRKRLGCQPQRDVGRGSACAGDSRWRGGSIGAYFRIGFFIGSVRSFDIRIITMMRSGWEKTVRRPRITRRWWAPPGTHDEENQPP